MSAGLVAMESAVFKKTESSSDSMIMSCVPFASAIPPVSWYVTGNTAASLVNVNWLKLKVSLFTGSVRFRINWLVSRSRVNEFSIGSVMSCVYDDTCKAKAGDTDSKSLR